MVTIAIVTYLELEEAVGIWFGARSESVRDASRPVTGKHLLAAYAAGEKQTRQSGSDAKRD